MNPRLKPLTAALSIAVVAPSPAAAADYLDPVIVTATRFSEPEVNVAANISVITGDDIRCAPYATFGTQALSDSALAALENRSACLLANHGMLVFGSDLRRTLSLAVEFETLSEHYWRACQLGAPSILSATEMAEVIALFETYGKPRPAPASGSASTPEAV